MGTLIGHVAPGFAFFAFGFWHLFNIIKLYSNHPKSFFSFPWFPTSRIRYLELFFIMVGSSLSIAMELFIGPARHQPFDSDGTIPSYHLHNFEHATISLTFFVYAVFAILLDRIGSKAQHALTLFIGAIAFAQQLLLFHLHSADHKGVEGQYHLLLQLVILVSLITTVLAIGYPKNFIISFVRSASILFQGAWLMLMGYMLWTPEFIPKGCFIKHEEGHQVVRCHGEDALHRAKSLVNLQFSWFLVGTTIFSVTFYLVWDNLFGETVEYSTLTREEDDESDDVESQQRGNVGDHNPNTFISNMGVKIATIHNMQR